MNYCGDECRRIEKIAEIYAESYREYYDKNKMNVVSTEYGFGGKLLHRGYYCPSLVIDVINGNVRRGKRIKKISQITPDFVYGFDVEGRLVTVDRTFNHEIIISQGLCEIGITFSNIGGIEMISECAYDMAGRIELYGCYLYNAFEKQVYDFQKEEYVYKENQMIVDRTQFNKSLKKMGESIHERYAFEIENSYLKNYRVECCDKQNIRDEKVYSVSLKRRI